MTGLALDLRTSTAPNELLRIARPRAGMRAWEVLWRQLAAEGTLR